MNAATLAAVILAAVSVLGALGGMAALSYRIGRLVGRVESMITSGMENYARLDRDIGRVTSSLDRHETWHRGPAPVTRH